MKMNGVLIGTAGYVIAESMLDSIISKTGLGLPSDMVELALGYYLAKRKGVIGNVGKVMLTINAYNVIKGFIGQGFNLLNPVATSNDW